MLLSKELIVPKKGKQIWPAETRPAVLVLVLRYGALNCAPLRSGPEQELNHSKPVIPASTQFMSFSKFYEFTERMLHQQALLKERLGLIVHREKSPCIPWWSTAMGRSSINHHPQVRYPPTTWGAWHGNTNESQ